MASIFAPTSIDLTRVPPPDAIEALDFETLYTQFKERFIAFWDTQRAINTALPDYDTSRLESDPAGIVGEAWSYLRLLDRQRVNDALKALLAPLATGANLDVIAAGRNIIRLVVQAATQTAPAILESDENLLRRYLLSFDMAAAGSRDRYLYEASKVWPQSTDKTLGLWDARVNGHAIHGRRGDTDIVIIGPFGRLATSPEKTLVRNAVMAPNVKPEAVSVAVLDATRLEYSVSLVIEVPSIGPDAELVRLEAVKRVRTAGDARMIIGGEVPGGLLAGSAYGPSIIRVRDMAPVVIEAEPYTIPVLVGITITVEVRA